MTRRRLAALSLALAASFVFHGSLASAHHGSAVSYSVQVDKLVTMKGTITEVRW
jgi:hypothetical protein